MNHYMAVLKKYAVFNGRATRAEYWYFILFSIIISSVLGTIDGSSLRNNSTLSDIYNFAVLVPSIAVGIRRMHDIGKSGWFILIPIYNIILFIKQGVTGENKYGSDPRATTEVNKTIVGQ